MSCGGARRCAVTVGGASVGCSAPLAPVGAALASSQGPGIAGMERRVDRATDYTNLNVSLAMDVTVLRLPNMQVVLNESDEKEEVEGRRLRSRLDSAGQESAEEREEEGGSSCSSETSTCTLLEGKRREPAHRRRNRRRVKKQQQRSGLQPTAEVGEEEVEELVQESGLERTTIEELLRKYGFGSWTQPEEVWRGRGVATYSTTRVANDIGNAA